MRGKKTYYEILGLTRNATPEMIKRRYRALARKHHPDVAEDKLASKAAFLEISEAYQTLSNPDKRTIYDSALDAEMFRVQTRRTTSYRTATGASPGPRPRPAQEPVRNVVVEAQRLIMDAESAFIQGHFRTAAGLARQARELDKRNIRAHVILGDIHRIQGQVEDAVAMYTIASQLDPRNADITAKLNRLIRHQGKYNDAIVARESRQAVLKIGLSLMGFAMGAFMFVMLAVSPSEPIPWLKDNLPMVGTFSMTLLAVLMITGALAGFLLSVNESVEPLDQELVFQGVRRMAHKHTTYPIGLILVLFNIFSFYVAVVIYTIMGLAQDSLSKSVYKSFAATFGIVFLASLVYTSGHDQVLAFGGNVAFPAVLFGWAMGDMFRTAG